jgi:hypothetical protein
MRGPDTFIVGGPKCGTTALAYYLYLHPAVFMTENKEPHFLAPDLWPLSSAYVREESAYLALFRDAGPQHRAVAEASVFYLFSDEALERLRARTPDARLVAMLRSPVEMAISLHNQLVYSFVEDERDFERAWALQAERRAGRSIPRGCRVPKVLQYADVCRLGSQVERMLGLFPSAQVKLVIFDDFRADPRAVYEEVLAFLGVPSDGRIEFPPVNERKEYRLPALARHLREPPRWLRRSVDAAKRGFGVDSLGISTGLRSLLTQRAPRIEPSRALRAEMTAAFRDDVARLGALAGRDLGRWLCVT